jgi:hypothetical protein
MDLLVGGGAQDPEYDLTVWPLTIYDLIYLMYCRKTQKIPLRIHYMDLQFNLISGCGPH